MGRVFLTSTAFSDPKELEYIILHEAAHSTRKHWLDLWISQLACMLFWFHPLIWRYRYLLRLQHEYEADSMAAGKDPYSYGQFLLRQTLLRGVPAIAHSFHFSPIKNRIHMLTKKQSFSPGNWNYLLLIPVLLGCTLLMANTG
jgi:beta-lactamase regulating signal transducer with metallopeptidase domain